MTTKPAIDEGMKAAFPTKLSERAERLTVVVDEVVGFEASVIARAIVTELGITPDMVSILRTAFNISPHRAYANDRVLEAADALSTLLEVAGQ